MHSNPVNDRFPMPTRRLYSYFTYYALDESQMQRGAEFLIGVHDFKSFCSVKSEAESTVREITYYITLIGACQHLSLN